MLSMHLDTVSPDLPKSPLISNFSTFLKPTSQKLTIPLGMCITLL